MCYLLTFGTKLYILVYICPPLTQSTHPWLERYHMLDWESGCFTVRSAYRLDINLKELNQGLTGQAADQMARVHFEKKLWSLPVPQKVKVFAWRLIHKGLATKKNKMERQLELSGTCDVCGQEVGDEFHAVISCDRGCQLLRSDACYLGSP